MIIKCQNCEREWEYKGTQEYYATCPNCRYKVPINWSEEQLEIIREIKKEKERGVGFGVGEQDTIIGEEEV